MMSNPYKEWKEDRQREAYEDILMIAEIIEEWRNKGSGDGLCDSFLEIVDILDKGGWV